VSAVAELKLERPRLPPAERAALRLLLSSALFAVMATSTKAVTRRLPGPEVALVRFLAGVLATVVAVAAGRARLAPRRWRWLLLRGLFGGSAVVAYFASIRAVPVGLATLLNQTQPVYALLFSWALLGERPRRSALGALVLTLAGVAVIVEFPALSLGLGSRAGAALDLRGVALGVFSAVASGVAVTSVRAARRPDPLVPPESAWTVFFSFTFLGALVTLQWVLPPIGTWMAPAPREWALLAVVAASSVTAQLVMTEALGHLTATRGGVIAQITVPMTVVLGMVLLGDSLSASFVAGAARTFAGVGLAVVASPSRRAPEPTV
jgi:drug/metabolite transporter (DMT)-like permease